MKKLNLLFYFPYNWYQYGSVKIRDRGKKIGKIKYGEETILEIPKESRTLTFSINFYKERLELEEINDSSYIVLYFAIENIFGIINPKILKAKTFKSFRERNDFCNSLYLNFGKTEPIKHKNKANLVLGIIISMLLVLIPFYPEPYSNIKEIGSENVNLPFILGIGGFVSYILIFFNKKISYSNYKSRIYVTIIAFTLSLLYINSKTLIIAVAILTFALLIRSYFEFKENVQMNFY